MMDMKINREAVRIILICLFFALGMILTFVGWKMTGKMEGLLIMIVGIIFLLTALFVYNSRFRDRKR